MKKNLLLILVVMLTLACAGQGNSTKASDTLAPKFTTYGAAFTDSTDFINVKDLNAVLTWSYKNLTGEANDKLSTFLRQYMQAKYEAWMNAQEKHSKPQKKN